MKALRVLLLLIAILLVGFIAMLGVGYLFLGPTRWSTQRSRMQTLTERAQPLVVAIEKYTLENNRPPKALDDLVPMYIATIPSTGLEHLPKFNYYVGKQSEQEYCQNPWVLTAFTPRGILNFDMMLYFPRQNYPDTGYGGRLERMGQWAYVHE